MSALTDYEKNELSLGRRYRQYEHAYNATFSADPNPQSRQFNETAARDDIQWKRLETFRGNEKGAYHAHQSNPGDPLAKPTEKEAAAWQAIRTNTVVLRTEVAHGRGSDPSQSGRASVFSNTPGSLMTSVGLYSVAESYRNTQDGSTRRRLDGLMVGFNDNARERAVVLHPSNYVRSGWAGRSEGCPAVSYAVMDQLNSHGLDNAVLWVEGDVAGLSESIAACSGSTIRKRFRWPWQPKLPAKPQWAPESTDAFNPYYQVEAEGFCPTPDLTAATSWWMGAPVYAEAVGSRWTVRY